MLVIANLEADTATRYRAVMIQAAALSHPSMRDVLLAPYPPAVQAATIWMSSYYSDLMAADTDVHAHDNTITWDDLFEGQTPPKHTSDSALIRNPLELVANAKGAPAGEEEAPADNEEAAGYHWRQGIERREIQEGRMAYNSSFIVSDKVRPTPTNN